MSIAQVAVSSSTEVEEAPPTFRRGVRVLIVDDIPENRLLLGLYCDRFGILHEAVEGGYEAVDAVRSGRFDVILMDVFMPRMDGMRATLAIRELPGPVCDTPIIAVTTAASPGEALRYRSCGMNDVVSKPIIAARLAEALSAALPQTASDHSLGRREPDKRRRRG